MLDGNNDAPLKRIVRHCSKSQTKKEQRKMLLSSVFLMYLSQTNVYVVGWKEKGIKTEKTCKFYLKLR